MELAPQYSRNVVQSFIAQGKVLVNGQPVTKAGTKVGEGVSVRLTAEVPKYVCRAGLKLEAALDAFGINPDGMVCLDSGLSTGGFTDCLLQRGARLVFGVDVGYGQVAERVRTDPRVVVMERTNVRLMALDMLVQAAAASAGRRGDIPNAVDSDSGVCGSSGSSSSDGSGAAAVGGKGATMHGVAGTGGEDDRGLQQQELVQQYQAPQQQQLLPRQEQDGQEQQAPQQQQQQLLPQQQQGGQEQQAPQQQHVEAVGSEAPVNLVTLDLSFISVLKVLPAVVACMAPGAQAVVLIKPQFEAGKAQVGAGGVVRDPAVHEEVIRKVTQGAAEFGLRRLGLIESPIKGATGGNTEFLAHFVLEA